MERILNSPNGASVTFDIDVPAGNYTIELFEHAPFADSRFRDTDHFIRSFPFTSNGSATTQTFDGFTATAGHTFSATITDPSRSITSEVSPSVIVPATNADNSSDQSPTTTTPQTQVPNGGEPAPATTTTRPATSPNNAAPTTTAVNGTPGNDAPTTQGATIPTTRPNQPVTESPALPGGEDPRAGTTPGPGPALPFRDDQPSNSTTVPNPQLEDLEAPDESASTESADPVGGAVGDSEDEANTDDSSPARAADIQSSSLTAEAEEIIEETQPELATIEGVALRTGRIVNELIDVRLTGFQVSSLVLAPILLIGLFLAFRRGPRLVSVTRVAIGEPVPQHALSDPSRSMRHDQLIWSTNRTRNVQNQSQTLVETVGGDRVWIPTRHITDTGY